MLLEKRTIDYNRNIRLRKKSSSHLADFLCRLNLPKVLVPKRSREVCRDEPQKDLFIAPIILRFQRMGGGEGEEGSGV